MGLVATVNMVGRPKQNAILEKTAFIAFIGGMGQTKRVING